jgi:RNA polymerase sigma-B factor
VEFVMVAALPLLREWDWLQEQVIPPLLNGTARHPKVWSIGSTADAVAVTVAFAHATRTESPEMQAFVSDFGSEAPTVSFARGEMGAVPIRERSRWFRQEDRRWIPDRSIADQVMMGQPSGAVDLVTIRPPDDPEEWGDSLASMELAGHLRPGGRVLFVEPPPACPAGLQPVNGEGRLFRNRARRTTMAGDGPDDVRLDSLTQRQLQQDLVRQHLRLARALAHRFLHRGEPADELEQVALLALVKASRRFDPTRNNTFATYATVSILGELKRHFRDKTWMLRVPRSTQELYLAIKEAREELGHELGRTPTVDQIATRLEVTGEAILEAMEAGSTYWTTSLDLRGPDGERGIDIPVADVALDRALDRERLRAVLPRLDHREQLVLQRLYFDGYTQQRVADELGASQMQVSRLLARTIAKLRRWCNDDAKELADDWMAQTA